MKPKQKPLFNLNDLVRVKILPKGQEIWNAYWNRVGGFKIKRDRQGYTEMQIHTMASVFGPHMGIGLDLVIATDVMPSKS